MQVTEEVAPPRVVFESNTHFVLRVRLGTTTEKREEMLRRWYRSQLRTRVPDLIAHWEPIIGVQVGDWGIRRIKTRWGTCNIAARRIWLNLELAKKPPQCLEYILVHEMGHLLERHHNDHFRGLMDRVMPPWRLYRDELNRAPLGHEHWEY